jgi:hypothetical protein
LQEGKDMRCLVCGLTWIVKSPGMADRTSIIHFRDCKGPSV